MQTHELWLYSLLHILLFLNMVEKGLQVPVHSIHVLIQNMHGLEVHKQEIFFKVNILLVRKKNI
jgi:hypothetical protein